MPSEAMYPRSAAWPGTGAATSHGSVWYSKGPWSEYARLFIYQWGYATDWGGWGRFDATAEDWIGKTQTWGLGADLEIVRSKTGDSQFNDAQAYVYLYANGTFVDEIFNLVEGTEGEVQVTQIMSLDVADWGTDFANIEQAWIAGRTLSIGPTTPGAGADIRVWDCKIVGSYTAPMGGHTLNSLEVPRSDTNHEGGGIWQAWQFTSARSAYGWFGANQTRSGTAGAAAYNQTAIQIDPSYDVPPINSPSEWTDHTNGETPTQVFFVLEHEISGADNDDVRIELVDGATPTTVEEVWSELDGDGQFTETTANISTPADWANHAFRYRYISSSGMMDTVLAYIFRIMADVEFPGLLGAVYERTATPTCSLDSTVFMSGEILITCGNSGSDFFTHVDRVQSAAIIYSPDITFKVNLDSTSAYVEANGYPYSGVYMNGVWPLSAIMKARLDSQVGQRVDTRTISDTTVVEYKLVLKDITGLASEIELPCIRANVTSRNGAISRANFIIPDIDAHLPLINTRLDGTLVLRATLTTIGGLIENTDDIVVVDIDEIDTTRTATESFIEVSGAKQRTFGAGMNWLIQTEGNVSEGELSGEDRITTLHDPRVRPGDFIDIRGASQATIKEILISLDAEANVRLMTLVPA